MLDRRQFLTGLAALSMGLAFKKPEQDTGLVIAPVSMHVSRDGETARKVLEKIEDICSQETDVDVIVTPEYSFFDRDRPLSLNGNSINYRKTHNDTADLINQAMELARRRKTHLFLGTFCEEKGVFPLHEWNSYNTLLHINRNGELTNIKRKGKFTGQEIATISKNGRQYTAVPFICADVDYAPITSAVLKSLKRLDLLIHSVNLGDAKFSAYADFIQTGKFTDPALERALKGPKKLRQWYEHAFDGFYSGYFDIMVPESKIVISDGATRCHGAVIRKDRKPILQYQEKPNYTICHDKLDLGGRK